MPISVIYRRLFGDQGFFPMRADRLISKILFLKQHGLVSACSLARELEVSPRAIYRDVEALHESDVPIYAEYVEDIDYWFNIFEGIILHSPASIQQSSSSANSGHSIPTTVLGQKGLLWRKKG